MWRPPQRSGLQPRPVVRRSAAEAAASRLFSPDRHRSSLTRAAHLGSGHGAVAGDRGRLRHRRGDRLVRAFRPRHARAPSWSRRPASATCRSGPLLRIGHDRFLPGLRRLVETVRRASEGRTRLFIQLIDFLAIRRRPDPKKFFERFLGVTDRASRRAGDPACRMPRSALAWRYERRRACRASLPQPNCEALRVRLSRARHRHAARAHSRVCPQVLPALVRRRRRARRAGRL